MDSKSDFGSTWLHEGCAEKGSDSAFAYLLDRAHNFITQPGGPSVRDLGA